MPLTPQLSLCIPYIDELSRIPEFAADVSSFFGKFPISYEVLLAAPQGSSLTLAEPFRAIPVKNAGARAKNLEVLFAAAQGEFLFAADLDLAIPLSECFKILQVFFSEAEVQAVFGDRTQKKKKLEDTAYSTALNKTETLFSGIIHDKTLWKFQDPFCPVFALRKSAFEKIKAEVKSRGWHWTPEIQRLVQKQGLAAREIPLYAGSRTAKRAPAMAEILGLLNFVLFRI